MSDSGEVLQGLDEPWTFLRANLLEWLTGMLVFLMISSISHSPASSMPLMVIAWVATTTSLAIMRNMFPDRERGLRNAIMTSCGFEPPGIPTPSALRKSWSGCPLRELPPSKRFVRLGLNALFPSFQRDLQEAEEPVKEHQ